LRHLSVPILLLLAAAVLFYLPSLLPGRVLLPLDILCAASPWSAMAVCEGRTAANPILSDQVFQFFPWHVIQKRQGWHGVLWNPYAFAGSPLLANGQSAPLYPPNWLHWVLPASWSYVLLAVFRTAVAACFTWAFARRHVSEAAALLAAVSYAFSFTFVFAVGYPIGDAMAWLPALVWAVDCRRWVSVSLFTALELLAGQPETALIVAFTVGAWFLWRRPGWKDVVRAALAAFAGTVMALPQLLPMLEYILPSAAFDFRNQYKPLFSSTRSMLEFLTPEFFGTSAPMHRWGSHEGGFFGLASFLLAVTFLAGRPRAAARNPWTWIFLSTLAIIYRVPPFSWLLELPYLHTVFFTKFWVSATFAGTMLAAHGLDEHVGNRIPRLLQFCLLPFAFCLSIFLSLWHFRSFIQALNLSSFETVVVLKFALLLIFALAVLRWRPAWTAALVFGECAVYLGLYNTAAPKELLYPRPPVVDFLKKDTERFRIMGDGVFPANTAAVYGLEDLRGYDAITPMRWFRVMEEMDPTFPDLLSRLNLTPSVIRADTLSQIDNVHRPLKEWGEAFRELLRRGFYWNERLSRLDRPELLDMLDVKYYLVPHGTALPQGLGDWRRVYSEEVDGYVNPLVFPRVNVLRVGNLPPVPAEILRYLPDEVVARAEGPGTLVLADAWDPGWHAEGFAVTPYQGLLRSVSLPSGRHTVRFLFKPW